MLKSSIPFGRFAGIPVGAHWSVLLMAALLTDLLAVWTLQPVAPDHPVAYWLAAVATTILFMASLLVHEVAHALVGRHFRLRPKRITLWVLGGFTEFDEEPRTPGSDALMGLAGPLASLAVGGVSVGMATLTAQLDVTQLVPVALLWIGVTNGVLAVFNLLPATPLDGGRILRAIIWKRTGNRQRGVAATVQSGQVVGGMLIAVGLVPVLYGQLGWLPLALAGWFVLASAGVEPQRSQLHELTSADVMTSDPVVAPGWSTVQAFLDRTAADNPQRTFPVVSFEGEPTGQICLADIARLPRAARMNTRVDKVCRRPVTVRPEDTLDKVAVSSALRAGRDILMVVQDGALVGVITPHDIARAIELRALGVPVHRSWRQP